MYFDQKSLKDGGKTHYLTHLHENSELRPRMSVHLTCGPRRDRGGISATSKHRNMGISIVSKHQNTVRLRQVKLAARGPRIETAGRRLFLQGHFVTMGTTGFYGLGTVVMLCCYHNLLQMGGQSFKVGQLFRLFNPDR